MTEGRIDMEDEKIFWVKDQEELESFSKRGRFVIYYSSKDCSVCHSVFPRLMELLKDIPIDIGRVDVNESIKLAGQNLIFSIPTIVIFDEGKEVLRESRFIDFNKIERVMDLMF